MRNIELKVKIDNFRPIIKSLKALRAKFHGELKQIDTYFEIKTGRLKFREINGQRFELIYYRRPDKKKVKISQYIILNLKKDQYLLLKQILSTVIKIKNIVTKKRELWIYKHTRIHLDDVKSLGNFLELETVLKNISADKGRIEYLYLIKSLKLEKYKKIAGSYTDLK